MRDRIGPFHVEGILADGGTGTVYLARDESSGRQAAVTALGAPWLAAGEERERLRGVLCEHSRLEHANLARVFPLIKDGGEIFLAEEQLPGSTLEHDLQDGERPGAIPLGAALAILLPVLSALAYLHQRGIAHHAVQPANVVMSDDAVRLKGLAAAAAAEACGETLPPFQSLAAVYLPPEQLSGAAADSRADVYSAAVVLYQLLSGGLPGAGATGAPRGRGTRRVAEAAALADLVPGLPAGVSAAVAIALHTDPWRRFESAAELRRALVEGAAGFLPLAPTSRPTRAARSPQTARTAPATRLSGEAGAAPHRGTADVAQASRETPPAGPSPSASTAPSPPSAAWQPFVFATATCILLGGGLLETLEYWRGRQGAAHPASPPPRPTLTTPAAPAPSWQIVPSATSLSAPPIPTSPPDPPSPPAQTPRRVPPPKMPAKRLAAIATPRSGAAETAAAVAAESARRASQESAVRQEIAALGARLDAQQLDGVEERLDALTAEVTRHPAELRDEDDEVRSLRRRWTAAQVAMQTRGREVDIQSAAWRTRLQQIQRLLDQGRFPEADALAVDLSQEQGVPEAVAAQARLLSERARDEIKKAWGDTRLGNTQNTLHKRPGKPPAVNGRKEPS